MKISKLRKERSLSQRALARELGYQHSVIAQCESGHRRPWPKLKKAIGDFFGIDWREVE